MIDENLSNMTSLNNSMKISLSHVVIFSKDITTLSVKRQRQHQRQGPIGMHCDVYLDASDRCQTHSQASQ